MPTNVKCVAIFKDSSGTGWSEVHYWQSSSDNPELGVRLANFVDQVCVSRSLLLSADCSVIGARVSYPRPGAVASLSKSFFFQGNLDLSGVSPAVSLAAKFTDVTNTRHKVTHLRGFWDAVEINGEYHPEGGAAFGWEGKLAQWKNALIAGGYGWLSKAQAASATGEVSGYEANDDGHIVFTLAGPGMPIATVGTIQTVRFSRLNGGRSTLNEQTSVQVLSPLSLRTVDQIAAGPSTGPGRFNYRATAFVGYSNLYDMKLGRRQQGRPFGQLPGRGRKELKY